MAGGGLADAVKAALEKTGSSTTTAAASVSTVSSESLKQSSKSGLTA